MHKGRERIKCYVYKIVFRMAGSSTIKGSCLVFSSCHFKTLSYRDTTGREAPSDHEENFMEQCLHSKQFFKNNYQN